MAHRLKLLPEMGKQKTEESMKKLLTILLSLLVLPALLFASGQQDAASSEPEQIVLRLGVLNPDSHPCGMAAHEFARLLEERIKSLPVLKNYHLIQRNWLNNL